MSCYPYYLNYLDDLLELAVDQACQLLLDDEQGVQVERHVVEPPLALGDGGVRVGRVLDLEPEALDDGRQVGAGGRHRLLWNFKSIQVMIS